jgi:glutamine---fructose-6-phosphate transaminase (isomerizing)
MNNSLSTNAYVNDLLHQPDALRATVAALDGLQLGKSRRFAERLSANGLRRIMLTGMGSSYYALYPLLWQLIDHGIQAQMLETSELIHFGQMLLSKETLVVAVSQSGRSVEMLQLLELAHGTVPLIGVTNTPESPLAQNSEMLLVTKAGSENTVSCKTYVATLAALAVLGDLLTDEDPGKSIASLGACAEIMAQYLSRWEEFLESASQSMAGLSYLVLAGRGPSLAAAGTGGLIIKEAACFPAEGMSSAAFRHGPMELLSPAVLTLIYEGTGPTRKLNAGLAADIQKAGGRSELITMGEGYPRVYNLPRVPEKCLPLMEILPAQLTSVALAVLNNHSPGYMERAAKITVIE